MKAPMFTTSRPQAGRRSVRLSLAGHTTRHARSRKSSSVRDTGAGGRRQVTMTESQRVQGESPERRSGRRAARSAPALHRRGRSSVRHRALGTLRRLYYERGRRIGRVLAARRRVSRRLEPHGGQHRCPEVFPRHPRHARTRAPRCARSSIASRARSPVGAHSDGYFDSPQEAATFEAELSWLLAHQRVAFNSPVWFNIGVHGVPQQASACFILAVDDEMESILDWYVTEGSHLQGRLGGRCEPVGVAGLVRAAVGRRGRRAARSASCAVPTPRRARSAAAARPGAPRRWYCSMPITPTSRHSCGARRARSARRAHLPPQVSTWISTVSTRFSVQYQNANNSVRLSDEFMKAVDGRRSVGAACTHERRGHLGHACERSARPDRSGGLGMRRSRRALLDHPSTTGTPRRPTDPSAQATRAANTSTSTTPPATWPVSICCRSSRTVQMRAAANSTSRASDKRCGSRSSRKTCW